MLKPQVLTSVNKEIYRRFPELRGVTPKVQERMPSGAAAKQATYLLIYAAGLEAKSPAAKGAQGAEPKTLPWNVRVVVDEQGKVLKISTSR
jgi:hypothetical protein